MPVDRPYILLVDANASDSALATLCLQRALPQAAIITAADAAALLGALAGAAADAIVLAPRLGWGGAGDILALLRRTWPDAPLILFGKECDIIDYGLAPGLALSGIVRKSSGGFLALPDIVREALDRRAPASGPAPHAAGGDRAPSTELSDMALICSHDLKQPLQQIVRLARRLDEGADGATAKVHEQLRSAAERASDMLDSLLEYLALSLRDETPATVDLDLCLEQALDRLRGEIEQAHAHVSSAPLPSVMGDALQMVHLLQNLIGNAIKFRSRADPEVHVEAETTDGSVRLSVTDNGIGIAPEHREHVFELGKRLHTREEYPGTGMGLALCRRIVERHGGSIRIDEAPGGGSRVVVELPRPPHTAARPA